MVDFVSVSLVFVIASELLMARILYVISQSSKPVRNTSQQNLSTLVVLSSASELLVARILYVISQSSKPVRNTSQQNLSTLVVLSSGGHTAEMINLLNVLQKDRFPSRFYIAAPTDNMSLQKNRVFEDALDDKILCNGPGTCFPICAIAFIFKVLGIRWSNIFYVESTARVKRLTLSGLLLYKLRMADQLFVQWPQLQKQYPRVRYVGRLM